MAAIKRQVRQSDAVMMRVRFDAPLGRGGLRAGSPLEVSGTIEREAEGGTLDGNTLARATAAAERERGNRRRAADKQAEGNVLLGIHRGGGVAVKAEQGRKRRTG